MAVNNVGHIRSVFRLKKMPGNVRWHDRLSRFPVLRRFSQRALRSSLIPASGFFVYRNNQEERTIRFNGRNLQFHALYESGYRSGYELESAVLMMHLCHGQDAFLDIGSNWGYFSLLMASLKEFTGPIFAFEPNPRTFADLASMVEQAGLAARIQPLNLGIGGKNCQMSLHEPDPLRTGLASLSESGDGQKISVKPLDELNLPAPRMIKIDAEGMEAEVLRGMGKTLDTIQPFVLFENFLDPLDPAQTCRPLEIFEAHGYRLYAPALLFRQGGHLVPATYGSDFNLLLERDPRPQLGLFEVNLKNRFFLGRQLNILAVHPTKMAAVWQAGILDLSRP